LGVAIDAASGISCEDCIAISTIEPSSLNTGLRDIYGGEKKMNVCVREDQKTERKTKMGR
jgi:hypothetical protein